RSPGCTPQQKSNTCTQRSTHTHTHTHTHTPPHHNTAPAQHQRKPHTHTRAPPRHTPTPHTTHTHTLRHKRNAESHINTHADIYTLFLSLPLSVTYAYIGACTPTHTHTLHV